MSIVVLEECRGMKRTKRIVSFHRVLILPTSHVLFKPTLELYGFEHWKINIYVHILASS